ncbi:endonuclease MutS2 [Chondromyces apiculatus]|uniref:Endonuclease MutS2 n=1 Tax=Chondromyces apiculatus DSM 436 TaxID=1192034 RepID=A0A017T9G7_9BACT|nr:Smr/MutS family protein [Chondromyces apiculatus]EYF05889.1 Recombination inhibitory protein MutS2 [Chondromyces apiculatus DSM 436]
MSDTLPETLSDPCPPKTRSDLEWDRILEALAARCASPGGRRAARELRFAGTRAEVLRSFAEVREAVTLDAAGEPLPVGEVPEIGAALDRARIGAVLSNQELREVLTVLGGARTLRQYLQNRRAKAPALNAACATDPALDDLSRDLASAFDLDGLLSDKASPRLGELRAEWRAMRERLIRRLEELIHKHEDILQDRYWTERDGRYVLPVRSDAHERFAGIVHAASASGATLFVEPRTLVEQGNRMKMLDAEVTREEQAIYAELTARVGDVIESVAAAARALSHADLRAGSARLAKDLSLHFPEVPEEAFAGAGPGAGRAGRAEALEDAGEGAQTPPPSIDLLGARHPLLALDGVKVVPSDLTVHAGRSMVISGPNAGGKTVALKTLGLAALMVRAGLPIPAKTGSRVALFEVVLTDVGDEQNLHKNLSTFSAHVRNIAEILGETRPGALVLLDELAVGTDPREGEALAAAVLDSLCARGGTVACTTHYEGLKALALGDGRFENASVGFDLGSMSPTFQLTAGIPGSSSALAVARRYGVPATVLERAERFLSREAVDFEQMVEKLAAERRALELARADAEREADAARARQRELQGEIKRLREKERAVLSKEGEAVLSGLRRAREELRTAQTRLRGRPTEEDLRTVSRTLDAIGQKIAIGGELETKPPEPTVPRGAVQAGAIKVGTKVYVPRLRAEAEVVEVLSGGQLRVAAGPLKLTTSIAEIQSSTAAAPAAAPARKVQLDAASDPEVPVQTSTNTVDLRGLRAHEAVSMAEQFIDRALGAGLGVVFLIHGHGTGALRDAVQESLRGNRYVARSRAGTQGEGGGGVTVAWLKW